MSQKTLWAAFSVAIILFCAGLVRADDERDLVRHPRPSGHLDDACTNLLYIKTTDYGATWSELTRAGDLSEFAPTTDPLADFSACVMDNNELCYSVYLETAAIPGIYALPGPNFQPVLAIPEGNNEFVGIAAQGGWTDIGRTPNGDLFVIVPGMDTQSLARFWCAKSVDNGATWSTPWIIATPNAPNWVNFYPHISDLNDEDWCFVLFQDNFYSQFVLRFPTTPGGAGIINALPEMAGSEVSYYRGNCKPIAYDPAVDALVICFRNSDLTGVRVGTSTNHGQNFSFETITYAQRYPSIALRAADHTPFVISNRGVPNFGDYHWAWYAYDEFGYGGGGWTDPDTMVILSRPFNDIGPLVYMNQAYFWDALHGIGMHNVWGTFTPESLMTSRTLDGGITWIDFSSRWNFLSDSIEVGSLGNNEVVGGSNGVAYVITAGHLLSAQTEHFVPVDPTLISYPVFVDSVHWEYYEFRVPDEIAVFDDSTCVGAAAFFGTWPVTVTCWQVDSAQSLPGFAPGDTMRFRVWSMLNTEELSATPAFSIGDGTFGFDSLSRLSLTADVPPGDVFLPDTVHDFTGWPVGASGPWWLQIRNAGTGHLLIDDVVSDTNIFDVNWPFPAGYWIAPGDSISTLVLYTPPDTNGHTGILTITSNDPDEPLLTVAVEGHGYATPPTPFTLIFPADGDSIFDCGGMDVSWHRSFDVDLFQPVHYDVWMDTTEDLSTAWQVADSIADTVLFVTAPYVTYSWTVRATDNNTPGTWASDTFQFSCFPDAATDHPQLPAAFTLAQNYPNPFNPATTISFALPRASRMSLTLFDVNGRHVRTLYDDWRKPGYHALALDARALPSGIYFIRMSAGDYAATRKIVLMK